MLSKQRGGSATRSRQGMTTFYDHVPFFADLSSRMGQCFATIMQNNADSRHFLSYALHPVAVGQAFLIVEAHPMSNNISFGLPLVTTDTPLLQLTFCTRDVPEVPLWLPHMKEMLILCHAWF